MQAVIFDFDGVLVDSERYWPVEEHQVFLRIVPGWKQEDGHRIVGMSIPDCFTMLQKEFGLDIEYQQFLDEYENMYDKVYTECGLLPGVRELLEDLERASLKIGIASSAQRRVLDSALERFKIAQYFQTIQSGDDVPVGEGKPHPKIYLLAAEVLGVSPAECVVIEDATNGIHSAKAAGMYCIGFDNGFSYAQDLTASDRVIKGLSELSADELKNL